jgi:hypothetical protein
MNILVLHPSKKNFIRYFTLGCLHVGRHALLGQASTQHQSLRCKLDTWKWSLPTGTGLGAALLALQALPKVLLVLEVGVGALRERAQHEAGAQQEGAGARVQHEKVRALQEEARAQHKEAEAGVPSRTPPARPAGAGVPPRVLFARGVGAVALPAKAVEAGAGVPYEEEVGVPLAEGAGVPYEEGVEVPLAEGAGAHGGGVGAQGGGIVHARKNAAGVYEYYPSSLYA